MRKADLLSAPALVECGVGMDLDVERVAEEFMDDSTWKLYIFVHCQPYSVLLNSSRGGCFQSFQSGWTLCEKKPEGSNVLLLITCIIWFYFIDRVFYGWIQGNKQAYTWFAEANNWSLLHIIWHCHLFKNFYACQLWDTIHSACVFSLF